MTDRDRIGIKLGMKLWSEYCLFMNMQQKVGLQTYSTSIGPFPFTGYLTTHLALTQDPDTWGSSSFPNQRRLFTVFWQRTKASHSEVLILILAAAPAHAGGEVRKREQDI